MGWDDKIGSLEKGKYGDMVAVSGDPLKDITELERIKFVMKGGKVIRNDFKRTTAERINLVLIGPPSFKASAFTNI